MYHGSSMVIAFLQFYTLDNTLIVPHIAIWLRDAQPDGRDGG